jgi:hypothetical protein
MMRFGLGTIAALACFAASSCPAAAAAHRPCLAAGDFVMHDPGRLLVVWNLHDRAGTLDGFLRYYAANQYTDLKPSIHQEVPVRGYRRGSEVFLTVPDPLQPTIVRKVHATLECVTRNEIGELSFHIPNRRFQDHYLYTREAGSSKVDIHLDALEAWGRDYADDIKKSRAKAVRDPVYRARVRTEQETLRTLVSRSLAEMAEVTPQ